MSNRTRGRGLQNAFEINIWQATCRRKCTLPSQLDSTWFHQYSYVLYQHNSARLHLHNFTLPSQLYSTRPHQHNYNSTITIQLNFTLTSRLYSTRPPTLVHVTNTLPSQFNLSRLHHHNYTKITRSSCINTRKACGHDLLPPRFIRDSLRP